MKMGKEYSCAECANAATPICELCRYVAKARGGITKPTMFVRALPAELIEDMTEEEKQEAGITDAADLAVRILACITSEVGIPLRYVMRYNTLVEDEAPLTADAELSWEESLTGGASPSPTEAEDSTRAAE
jgi:hypothetical protein